MGSGISDLFPSSQLLSANNCDPRRERVGSVARKIRGSELLSRLDAGKVGVERQSDRDAFMTGLEPISNILPELVGSI